MASIIFWFLVIPLLATPVNVLFDDIKKEDTNFIYILTGAFCKEIGLNVKNLSEEELEMLHSIFERSKRYKEFIKNKKNSKKRK